MYQECLEIELHLQDIPFRVKHQLQLHYKGRPLQQVYIPDFICFELVNFGHHPKVEWERIIR